MTNQNETKSEQIFVSDEMIERAARAAYEYADANTPFNVGLPPREWDDLPSNEQRFWMGEQRAALTAAGVTPQPMIDEAALAEVITKHTYGYSMDGVPLGCDCGHDEGEDRHAPHIAAIVTTWLKEGAK